MPTLPSFSIGTIMAGRGPHVVLIAVGVRTAGMQGLMRRGDRGHTRTCPFFAQIFDVVGCVELVVSALSRRYDAAEPNVASARMVLPMNVRTMKNGF